MSQQPIDEKVLNFIKQKEIPVMSIVKKVKDFDKMSSKYFIPFSIIFFAFAFGWTFASGETIFSSLMQDISIFFILVNQGVIIGYLTWYKD